MPSRAKIFIILPVFITLLILAASTSSAQIPSAVNTETDFARDVRIGIDQTTNDPAASVLQSSVEENQIVEGKISTSTGVDVVEVIQSMDQTDLNKDFTPAEEMTQNDTEEKSESNPDLNMVNPTEKMGY